jgi:transcriptional regulator with XRE-family HTH domain
MEYLNNSGQQNQPFDDTMGGRIASAREALNLTSEQLARRLGVDLKTLQNWELDQSEPRANRLVTLSGILNVSPTWILMGGGDGPSQDFGVAEIRQAKSEVRSAIKAIDLVRKRLKNAEETLETVQNAFDSLVEEAETET